MKRKKVKKKAENDLGKKAKYVSKHRMSERKKVRVTQKKRDKTRYSKIGKELIRYTRQ